MFPTKYCIDTPTQPCADSGLFKLIKYFKIIKV